MEKKAEQQKAMAKVIAKAWSDEVLADLAKAEQKKAA